MGTGQRIVHDAVVTSTLARTYVVGASRKAGAAAGAGHARKQGKWRALVQAEPDLTRAFQFVPVVAESTGVLHSSTRQLLMQLVGEVQGRRRDRRGAGVWLRPQEATAAYWRAAMTVELEFTKLRTASDLNAAGRHEQVRDERTEKANGRARADSDSDLL